MQKKFSILETVLTIALILVLGVVAVQAVKIKTLKTNLLSLIPGETIPDLDILDIGNEPLEASIFEKGKVSVLAIFSTPCAKCNKNLNPWKTMSQYFGDRVKVIGIIPDGDSTALELIHNKVKFKIYLPVDKKQLSQKLRLKTRYAQTILVYGNEVKSVTIGDLNAEDLQNLVKTVRNMIEK